MIHKFTHNGKDYEVRAAAFADGYQAAVFCGDKKLCENVRISFESDSDMKVYTGESGLGVLVRALEGEVKSGKLHA